MQPTTNSAFCSVNRAYGMLRELASAAVAREYRFAKILKKLFIC